jgi:hypothetical protein
MLDIIKTSKMIELAIGRLGDEGKKLEELTKASALASSEYDKAMGAKIARLKGEGTPTTIVEKLAKADCSDLLYMKILAEGMLKACYSNIDRIKAQLNGYQSINRHLDTVH